jgi:hypothetical protein
VPSRFDPAACGLNGVAASVYRPDIAHTGHTD